MNRKPPELPPDVPSWVLTYSDVITLLMTFFILLLTFSTTEPERFEQIQVTLFGDSGSSGFAGPSGISKEALFFRERPRASRMFVRGAEMPPIHTDPSGESVGTGLKSLETAELARPSNEHVFNVFTDLLIDRDGSLTELGEQVLRMFGRQLVAFPFELQIQIQHQDDLPTALMLATELTQRFKVPAGRVGIGLLRSSASARNSTKFVLNGTGRG